MTGSGTQGLVVLFTDTDNTVEVDLRRETMDLVCLLEFVMPVEISTGSGAQREMCARERTGSQQCSGYSEVLQVVEITQDEHQACCL